MGWRYAYIKYKGKNKIGLKTYEEYINSINRC